MKAGAAHMVPLSARAVEILNQLPRKSAFVFPGRDSGRPIARSTISRLLPDGATAHGMRSCFRSWVLEQTSFPRELAELAQGHVAGDQTERAYRRGQAIERRRELMESWANYCENKKGPAEG